MNEMKRDIAQSPKAMKEQPFRLPDHYFDDFYARLHVRLEAEENALPKKNRRAIRYLKPVLGLTASFALIFLLVYWPMKSFLPGYLATTKTYIEPTNEEEAYYSIIEKMDENSFFTLLTESSQNTYGNKDFNDEELLSYLSANVSDYEIFIQTKN